MAAEVCTAVVSAVASKFAELLFDPIQREICYVFKYKSNVEKLRSQLENLNNIKQRLEQTVENAKRQGDKIFDDVESYLIKMNEFIERAEKLVNEEEDKAKNKRCFIGFCPKFMSHHKLSKEAVKAVKEAEDLFTEGNGKLLAEVSYRPPLKRIERTNETRAYEQFDSRMKVFNNVMEALKDSNVGMIGVYGMGGVGKTTLAKQVEKKVVEDKLFDEVVMAEVTQTPDLKTIQDKFAYDLGLTFLPHENEFERVGRLHRRLKQKRVLIILDNIWKKLELEAIGIPLRNDEEKGKDVRSQCTVLLTSRDHHVLCNDMKSEKNFLIEVLSDKEAMILLWKTVDNHSMEISNFQLLADGIIEKCGGLPVAIITVASALKNKTLEVWKDALNQLCNSDARNIPGMDANVYSAIKLSYNISVNEEAKSLFRLCALQNDGSRILINDLVTYVMGSGWFKNVQRVEQVRNRVHALIDNLKSSSLLLDGDDEHVKMHDIIHAVGVSIATEEHMFNIQNVGDFKEELENVIPKDPIAISLTCRDIGELPQRLECPKLKLFLIFANYRSRLQIQNLFFEEMKELRVLNLTRIFFPSSLISLAYLSNLRTLSLIDCHSIVDVALVGELKKLQILSFRGSDIMQLPLKIGQLTELKKLDLSYCSRLKVIAPNVISKLSRLEELYMVTSFTQWEKGEGGSNASLVELNALSQLTTLEITIPDVKIMSQDLVSVELERFKIFIGDVLTWIKVYDKSKTSRKLKFSGLVKNFYMGKAMKMLLKRAEDLNLDKLNGFQNVINELDDGEGFPQLKHLYLQCSLDILHVVNTVGRVCSNSFPLLESLVLHNLMNLEKICHGQLTEDQSFSKLRIIKVEGCPELKHLFSFSMGKNLLRLQEMEVTNCYGLKFIVGEERENYIVCDNEDINFTQLYSLELTGLPQLKCSGFNLEISRRLSATSSSASKEIIAEDDPQDFITVLFNNKVTFPTLETLKLSSLNIEKIWLDQFSACQNLTILEVEDCSHVNFLFSYSMVHSLVQLQELVIEGCKSMEWVINTNGLRRDEEQKIGVMVFPKLKILTLSHLPRLTRFVSLTDTNTQSLFDEKVELPSLEVLEIKSVHRLRKIWHHQLDSDSFSKLKQLEVTFCDKLMNIFSSNIILGRRFQRLERVRVFGCKLIKDIIEEEASTNRMVDEFPIASTSIFQVFPQLTSMQLEYLPDLKSIYEGVHMFEWPRLKNLEVSGSDKVEILFGFSELLSRETEISQPVFFIDHHKVRLPILETLRITSFSKLRTIWHHQLDLDSFSKLKQLEVTFCDILMNIFSSNIVLGRRFPRLEKVSVFGCKLIQEIIEEETSSNRMVDEEFPIANTSRLQVFPQLTSMQLQHLPELKSIYQGVHMLEWRALEDLKVAGCEKVEILFGSSELLSRETESQQPMFLIDHHKVGLPSLETLRIISMNKLRKIWHYQLILDSFCKLKQLEVCDCVELMNIFPSNIITERRLERLESLSVNYCGSIKEIIEEETCSYDCIVDEEFPLVSTCSSFQVFPQLTSLCLQALPSLTNIYQGIHMLEWPTLKDLSLFDCEKVEILFGSSEVLNWEIESQRPLFLVDHHKVAFPNLKTLKVVNCRNLMTLSPVESLVNLVRIEIHSCGMIEKIVQLVGEVKGDPIVFSQLVYLELDNLPRLEHFFGGNYTFEFPYLEQMVVNGCLNMKIFSQGVLHTPKLQKVQLTNKYAQGKEERWEGSLNSTIQKMFEEMAGFYGLKNLILSQVPHVKEIWYGQTLPVSFFDNIRSLEVDDCKLMLSAIPTNLLRFLNNLIILKVRNCDFVEEVVHLEELNAGEHSVQLFPILKELYLLDLPKLKRFCSFSGNIIELPCLRVLSIENCPNMETFISNSTCAQPLFNEKVAFRSLRMLKLSKLPKLLHLCKENSSPMDVFKMLEALKISECSKLEKVVPSWVSFRKLIEMKISKCDGLINLVALSTAESMVELRKMEVTDCKMIEEIIHIREDVKKDSIVFRQLKYLELSCLPSLTSFCLGNYTLEFPFLEQVILKECPKMEIFSRGVLITPKVERLQLTEMEEEEIVKQDEWLWEGSLNSTIQKLFKKMNV